MDRVEMGTSWTARTLVRCFYVLASVTLCGIFVIAFSPWSRIAPNHGPYFAFEPSRTKWVVVSEGNTQSCSRLEEAFGGWRILLVNREKARNEPQDTSDCRYLSGRETQALQRRFGLPDSTLAGILFAVRHSAEEVYVHAVDERTPQPASIPRRNHWLSAAAPTRHFPSARHFGCNASLVHARGGESGAAPQYSIVRARAPAMAAVARLVMTSSGGARVMQAAGMACDAAAPSVLLPPGTYAQINQPAATVHYAAIWAFSATCHRQATADCALWNFVLQYLLWQTGHTLLLVYDPSGLEESSQNPSPDAKLTDLQRFLEKWQCSRKSTVACGKDLINDLAQSALLSDAFAASQIAWFTALQSAGYAFPAWKKANSVVVTSDVIFHAVDFTEDVPWVQQGRNSSFLPVANHARTSQFYGEVCGSVSKHADPLPPPPLRYTHTLLLIVFNIAYYDNIPYLETLYRSTFPRILYCGPDPLTGHAVTRDYNVSFVTYSAHVLRPGSLNYECMMRAVSMNYRVAGYLLLADDMLLLPQTLRHHNASAVWYMKLFPFDFDVVNMRSCRNLTCDSRDRWPWWKPFRKITARAITGLRDRKNAPPTLSQCYHQLASRYGKDQWRVVHSNADTFYVPARLGQKIFELFQHFLRHRVFLEIAVPTVLNCVTEGEEIQNITGILNQLIGVRDTPWKHFNSNTMLDQSVLHPTKWSYVTKSEEAREWFCSSVISLVYSQH